MTLNLPEFDTVAKKELDSTHELLKLRCRENGLFALFMTAKGTQSGAVFGGHNWEEIGRHPKIINEYFNQISSRDEFIHLSSRFREELQALIEAGK